MIARRAAGTLVLALVAGASAATSAAQTPPPLPPAAKTQPGAVGQATPIPAPPASQSTSASSQTDIPDQATPPGQGPEPLDRRQQFSPINASALFSLNGIVRSAFAAITGGDVAGERTDPGGFGTGSAELSLALRPTPNFRIFVDAEGLVGSGPEQVLGTLSRVNSDAEALEGRDSAVLLREFWLRFALANNHIRLSVGRLDPAHYFDRNSYAEDDTTQFMNDALLNDPMLKPPPNALGATLRFSWGEWRYAFGFHAPDALGGDQSGHPYLIAEAGRRHVLPVPGRWQWWVRTGSVEDDRSRSTWGTGVSIDQSITAVVGIFVRCGLSRTEGETLTSTACAGGAQFTPGWWQRAKDRLGLGYTYQRELAGSEKLLEGFWSFAVYRLLWVTADVQWLISGPNQEQGGQNRHVLIPTVRAALLF